MLRQLAGRMETFDNRTAADSRRLAVFLALAGGMLLFVPALIALIVRQASPLFLILYSLAALAIMAGLALALRRLLERAGAALQHGQAQTRRFHALLRMCDVAEHRPDDVPGAVVTNLTEQAGYACAQVYLIEGDRLVLKASAGGGGQLADAGESVPLDDSSAAGRAALNCLPVAARPGESGRRTGVSLPLVDVAAGEVLGVLSVQAEEPDTLSAEDLEALGWIGKQIGAALQAPAAEEPELSETEASLRAQLDEARREAARERELRRIGEALRYAGHSEEIRQIVNDGLARALGRPAAEIEQARNGKRDHLTEQEWQIIEEMDRQVQTAIASVRFLERSQQTAERGQIISDITARLQRSAQVNDVLEETVRALHAALDGYDIRLRLAPPGEGAMRPADDAPDGANQ